MVCLRQAAIEANGPSAWPALPSARVGPALSWSYSVTPVSNFIEHVDHCQIGMPANIDHHVKPASWVTSHLVV